MGQTSSDDEEGPPSLSGLMLGDEESAKELSIEVLHLVDDDREAAAVFLKREAEVVHEFGEVDFDVAGVCST